MSHSMFDMFKVGIGPSSSHTVGPMSAAARFAELLEQEQKLQGVQRVTVDLYGSLALTGKGHATDLACVLGLMGETPAQVDPDQISFYIKLAQEAKELPLNGKCFIRFEWDRDIHFHYTQSLDQHPNGMTLKAYDKHRELLLERTYFSVGGGFIVEQGEQEQQQTPASPYPFSSAKELLSLCQQHNKSIAEIMFANTDNEQAEQGLDNIWAVMSSCIQRGIKQSGMLPGGLNIPRRAAALYKELNEQEEQQQHLDMLDWVNLFAMAVNEENAAGGRVVTAPTNGAAGVIPAVVAYYDKFIQQDDTQGIRTLLATASAIGLLFKNNASISAAEVGCQGEIGVACSMAAAGLTAAMGGTPEQVENAAEIGMEHNLGLTCDPIDGLVQVPCIERNTMGAVKAINASRLALRGNGVHHVHLDDVIETMRQTGLDMMSKYKETSQGGLAINVVAC